MPLSDFECSNFETLTKTAFKARFTTNTNRMHSNPCCGELGLCRPRNSRKFNPTRRVIRQKNWFDSSDDTLEFADRNIFVNDFYAEQRIDAATLDINEVDSRRCHNR